MSLEIKFVVGMMWPSVFDAAFCTAYLQRVDDDIADLRNGRGGDNASDAAQVGNRDGRRVVRTRAVPTTT